MRTASQAGQLIQYGLLLHVCLPGANSRDQFNVHVSFILASGGYRSHRAQGTNSPRTVVSRTHSGTPQSVAVRLLADKTVHDAMTECTDRSEEHTSELQSHVN